MFDSYENSYPEKPTLKVKKAGANMSKYFLVIALLFLILSNITASNYWIIFSFIGAVAFHEFGHFIGMTVFRYQEPNFMFYSWLAEKANVRLKPISQKNKIVTLQLGSVPGIVAGVVMFIFAINNQSEIWLWLSLILISVNLFSLLPIDPLDGGNIIKNLFFPKRQKPYLFFVLFSSIAIIIAGFLTEFYMVMILGFLMGAKVRSIQKNMMIYDVLENEKINYNQSYKNLSDKDYWKIRGVFLNFNPKLENIIPSGYEIWENEVLLTNQIKQLLKADVKLDASPIVKLISFVIYLACILVPIYLILSNYDIIVKSVFEKFNSNV